MSGSDAEERIRAKAVAELRAEFPGARIIHELNMEQAGIRLDLAAVRSDGITLAEIKSERDVLKRLGAQLAAALRVTGDVRVYVAEKHADAVNRLAHSALLDDAGRSILDWSGTAERSIGRYRPNPDYIADLNACRVRVETEDGFRDLSGMHESWWPRLLLHHMADPRAILQMLWAAELRAVLGREALLCSVRDGREAMKRTALEFLSGRQIRRSACAALLMRPFARADDASSQHG